MRVPIRPRSRAVGFDAHHRAGAAALRRLAPPPARAAGLAWSSAAPGRMVPSDEYAPRTFIDLSLLAILVGNQLAIGLPALALGGARVFFGRTAFGVAATWLGGLLSAVPLIALGRAIERSRSEAVIDINWATSLLALKLFGYSQQPLVAAAVCAALASLVGVVEEVLFRGLLLGGLKAWLVGGLGAPAALGAALGTALSAALFAALHLNPRQVRPSAEAAVTLGLQFTTGAWLGVVAQTPRLGGLGGAIIAHALYDFCTFYATHLAVTSQYEYARVEARRDMSDSIAAARWAQSHPLQAQFVRDAAYLFHFCDADRNLGVAPHEVIAGLRTYGVRLSAPDLRERWRAAAVGSAGGADAAADAAAVGRAAQQPPPAELPAELSFEQYLDFLWEVRLSLTRETSTLRDEAVRGVEQKGLLGLRPTQ